MNRSRRFVQLTLTAILALTLTGCAPMRVNSFLARGSDFTRYRTYRWAPDDQLVTGDPRLDGNPFFLDRLQGDVDKELAARGLEKTTVAAPELLLHYHARVDQRLDVSSSDRRYGDCDRCEPLVYDAGTIVIDFVDARTSKLVWRGWAEGSMDGFIDNQEWMEQKIDDAVTRILARLPRRASPAGVPSDAGHPES